MRPTNSSYRLAWFSTGVSLTGIMFTFLVSEWPVMLQLGILVVGVCLIGLPHGALDHLFGRKLYESTWGRWWCIPFLSWYGFIALSVALGWWFIPIITLLSFVSLAIVHFGAEERPKTLLPRVVWWPVALLTGSMLSGVQAIAQPIELTRLINEIVPTSVTISASTVEQLGWVWAAVAIPCFVVLAAWYLKQSVQGDLYVLAELSRLVTLAVALAMTPPLVGFVIYFCGWHSLLGWLDLIDSAEREHPGNGLRLVVQAAWPTTFATILVGLLAAAFFGSGMATEVVATRTVFIVLSCVAVPHLALHTLLTLKDVRRLSFSIQARPA